MGHSAVFAGNLASGEMVGAIGFEPTTLWSQTRCATRLRYAPESRCNEMRAGRKLFSLRRTQSGAATQTAPLHVTATR